MNNLSFLFAATTLNQESIKLLDGDLTLYKRPHSQQWQCRFKLATGVIPPYLKSQISPFFTFEPYLHI